MADQQENGQHGDAAFARGESGERDFHFVRMEGGRFFQEQWIRLVKEHSPDNEPFEKLFSWEDLEAWEQENAVKIYELVQHLAWTVGWPIDGLDREQKGRFIHTCLIAQVWKRAPQREGIAHRKWEQLPVWLQQVYADLFEMIEWYQEVADVPDYVSFFKEVSL